MTYLSKIENHPKKNRLSSSRSFLPIHFFHTTLPLLHWWWWCASWFPRVFRRVSCLDISDARQYLYCPPLYFFSRWYYTCPVCAGVVCCYCGFGARCLLHIVHPDPFFSRPQCVCIAKANPEDAGRWKESPEEWKFSFNIIEIFRLQNNFCQTSLLCTPKKCLN